MKVGDLVTMKPGAGRIGVVIEVEENTDIPYQTSTAWISWNFVDDTLRLMKFWQLEMISD